MQIDILTLFPEMCEAFLGESIIGRARKADKVTINCHNIRDYTTDKHNRVDDTPYGGGMGMIMSVQPVYDCVMAVSENCETKPHVVYLSPKGKTFTQKKAIELSKLPNLVLLCGHYEGIDERVLEEVVDEEISIGDFVLTGGEIAAMAVVDAVSRLIPGVLKSDISFSEESHFNGLLEYPQYTRPEVWHNKKVPDVLMSGHHKNIELWKREMSILNTFKKRRGLLSKAKLSNNEKKMVNDLKKSENL